MESRPWTVYHFFDVNKDITEKIKDIKFSSADSGHGLLCFSDENGTIFLMNNKDEPRAYVLNNYKIHKIYLAKYTQNLLAVCTTEKSLAFYFMNTQTLEQCGLIEIPIADKPEKISVAVSPKLHRFGFLVDPNHIHIFQQPFNKKSKPSILEFEYPVTNHYMLSDSSLQRLYYITTEKTILVYSVPKKGKSKLIVLDSNRGCIPQMACPIPDGRLAVVRGKEVTIYDKTSSVMSFEIDNVPRLISWMKGYLITAFSTPSSSSVRLYNHETHSTFGNCGDGERVNYILSEWNSVLLILDDNTVIRLTETDMQEKINQLMKNEQFEVALAIAKSQAMPDYVIAGIHRQRADSYQAKHQYDKAIKEYIKTIGFIEPSYVITRFIDPQHAEFLIQYLEELSNKRLATKQHTTLRFNCYTKLRATEKLQSIVQQCLEDAERGLEPNFDVLTAVQVLTLGGFQEEALKIACAYHMHMTYVDMLADSKDYQRVFEHLKTLDSENLTMIVKKYGLDILKHFKDESNRMQFTVFLFECCAIGVKGPPPNETLVKTLPDEFMRVFLTYPRMLYQFLLQLVGETGKNCSSMIWNTVIEASITAPQSSAEREFITYFDDPNAHFTAEDLLLLFQSQHFKAGLLKLFRRLNYYEEIIKLSKGKEIIEVCKEFGDIDPSLWRKGLRKLVLDKDTENTKNMLDVLSVNKAIPFLVVMKILQLDPNQKFSLMKEFARDRFKSQQSLIRSIQSQSLLIEGKMVQQDMEAQNLSYDHYIAKQTRCENCKGVIDLPAKHFLCGHSYHMSCLGDDVNMCIQCKEAQEKAISAKIANFEKSSDRTSIIFDMAFQEDGFSFMSNMLNSELMTQEADGSDKKEAIDLLKEYNRN